MDQRFKSKNNVANMLEENMRESFYSLGIGRIFQIMTQNREDLRKKNGKLKLH